MKIKKKSILISLFIITLILTFLSLIVASLGTPNLSKEIKKDIMKGTSSLCKGDIENYYNIYNTRKLTEIEKTKFYERIIETQEIVSAEKELFKKYKLKIQIKDVSIIKKISNNIYLCNINVNYKYRKKHNTTDIFNKTEDYIVKIIDVGNMDYKILLPFNSLDKDFYSGQIFKLLKEENSKKEAEKIKLEREKEEKEKLEMEIENAKDNTYDDSEHDLSTDETLNTLNQTTNETPEGIYKTEDIEEEYTEEQSEYEKFSEN